MLQVHIFPREAWRRRQAVRQGSAKPSSPVRIRSSPPEAGSRLASSVDLPDWAEVHMELADAFTELSYAKDWSPSSHAWYTSRLGAFMAWAREHGVTELEDLTTPLIRRYIDHLQHRPTKVGKLLDSFTVHGHVRAIRTLLFWAAAEDLIDEKIPNRIAPPRRE
jgi:hypothetical protein